MTTKDKKIIEDSEKNGTPIFVLTAKDALSVYALHTYGVLCAVALCNDSHLDGIKERIAEFDLWRHENYDKMKKPD